jgi:hypothetical protein
MKKISSFFNPVPREEKEFQQLRLLQECRRNKELQEKHAQESQLVASTLMDFIDLTSESNEVRVTNADDHVDADDGEVVRNSVHHIGHTVFRALDTVLVEAGLDLNVTQSNQPVPNVVKKNEKEDKITGLRSPSTMQ